mgnify:FL=1
MTTECDCYSAKQAKCIPDIGILASRDPVAIDLATLDLTEKFNQKTLSKIAFPHIDPLIQLRHGEKIGLGSLTYKLIEIS